MVIDRTEMIFNRREIVGGRLAQAVNAPKQIYHRNRNYYQNVPEFAVLDLPMALMSNCSSFCNSSLGLSRLVALAKISKSPFTSKASGSIVELSHVLRIRDDRSIKDAGLAQDFFPNLN